MGKTNRVNSKLMTFLAKYQPFYSISISLSSRRVLLGLTAGLIDVIFFRAARADLVTELLEKTSANIELNNKKRLATSYANFARSRTVTDKTCRFPDNFLGCQNAAELGNVKFLTDDIKIECQSKEGACTSKSKGNLPSFMGF